VVRTEVNRASNMDRLAQYIEAGVTHVEWHTAKDDRVRGARPHDKADHRKLHGQRRRIGEPFEGKLGWRMRWPGDRGLGAPPYETVNCRCTLLPIWEENEGPQLPREIDPALLERPQPGGPLLWAATGYEVGGIRPEHGRRWLEAMGRLLPRYRGALQAPDLERLGEALSRAVAADFSPGGSYEDRLRRYVLGIEAAFNPQKENELFQLAQEVARRRDLAERVGGLLRAAFQGRQNAPYPAPEPYRGPAEWLARLTHPSTYQELVKGFPKVALQGERPWYDGKGLITLPPGTPPEGYAYTLGQYLEVALGLQGEHQALIRLYATGEPVSLRRLGLKEYPPREKAWPGVWEHPAVGRVLPDGRTEWLSTGLEALYGLWEGDPAYLGLMLYPHRVRALLGFLGRLYRGEAHGRG